MSLAAEYRGGGEATLGDCCLGVVADLVEFVEELHPFTVDAAEGWSENGEIVVLDVFGTER